MLLLSKDKNGEIFTFTKNVNLRDMPLGLRKRENIQFTETTLEMSFENLWGYIEKL